MKTTLFLFMAIIFLSTTAQAEQLEAGKMYSGPVKIEVAEVGFSFDLPKGWVGKLVGEEFMAQKGSEAAVFSVNVSKFTKKEALVRMSSPVQLDANVVIKPTKKPKVSGNKIFVPATMTTPEGALKSEVRVVLGKYGFSAMLLGFGKSEANFKAMQKTLKAVEKSVKFKKIIKVKSSGYWGEYLMNRSLTQASSRTSSIRGNGSSSTTRYTFCPNGTFYSYSSESAQSRTEGVASVSASSSGSDSGTWTATGAKKAGKLNLTWKNGSKATVVMSYGPKGELLVDGERWWRKQVTCE